MTNLDPDMTEDEVKEAFADFADAVRSMLEDIAEKVRSAFEAISDVIHQIVLLRGDYVMYCPMTGDPFANEHTDPDFESMGDDGLVALYDCQRCKYAHTLFHWSGEIRTPGVNLDDLARSP